jgi:hypothetical protein
MSAIPSAPLPGGSNQTILGEWVANFSGGGFANQLQTLDPVGAAVVIGILLLILAAIPATSKFALWIAFGILVLLIITGKVQT